VKEFVETAFACVELDYRKFVKTDPDLFRPAEVNILLGDAAKAREKLGWIPKTTFRDLVWEMVDVDCRNLGVAPPTPLALTAQQ
jgi:GDPmannose 4,6-dehydratase